MLSPQFDTQKLNDASGGAIAMLRVLANEDRLLLLCQLAAGEACVSELESPLAIRQPTLSQQLRVLLAEAIVSTRREGKKIYHQISAPRARSVLDTLYSFYCELPQDSLQPAR